MDGNAKIEVDDFNQWSAKLAKIGGLNAERSAALAKSLLAIWNTYFLPADTNKSLKIFRDFKSNENENIVY